jgi:radical SAM superfamily enzyme YgiQ (UPF0313 family)
MRVCLVNPPGRGEVPLEGGPPRGEALLPLGIGYLASVLLNDGHEVSMVDMTPMGFGESELYTFLKNGNFDLVGSGSVTSGVRRALRVLEIAKKVAKDIRRRIFTVYGGVHASLVEEKMFDEKTKEYLDAVVVGEGEHTLKELARCLEEGGNLKNIKGLIYLEDGKVHKNPARPPIQNLDELPFPAWDLLPTEKYTTFGLITSRGCPYRCIFCCVRYHLGNQWRARSPENVIEEIGLLIKKYNAKHFVFLDDSFNLNMERAKKICQKILENGWEITWEATQGIRLDRIDSELATLMKKSGCLFVGAGIETGDAEILRAIKKGLTKEKIAQSVQLLHKAGITTRGFFLIGNPGETVETLKEAIKFGKELKLHSLGFTFLMPYPKTEYKEWVEKHGKIIVHEWEKYDGHLHRPLVSLPTLSPSEAVEAWHWIIKEVARYNLSRYLTHPSIISKSARVRSELAPIYHSYHIIFNLIPEALGLKKELVDLF